MPISIHQQLSAAAELENQGQLQQAAAGYQKVLAAEPDNVSALRAFGALSLTAGHPEMAATLLEKAVRLGAGSSHAETVSTWLELARARRQLGQADAAREAVDQALQHEDTGPDVWLESGHLHSDAGDAVSAIRDYHRALKLDSRCVEALYSLSFLHQTGDYTFSADERRSLQSLLEQLQALPLRRVALLHFTQARILHKAGDYPAAFAAFQQANRAQHDAQQDWERYRLCDRQELLRRSREVFTGIKLHTPPGNTPQPPMPVFIVGMPRCGSTLLESYLIRHTQIAGAGESAAVKNVARQQLPRATGQPYPDHMPAIPDELARMGARHVIGQLQQRLPTPPAKDVRLIIDKMPTNFEYLGLIARLFPGAPVIHLRRDPMDTLWSCFQQNLAARYSNDFGDLEGQYRCYRGFMDLWRGTGLPMLELDYETLVSNFESVLPRVIDYLGLEWDERCLDSRQTGSAITTASRMQVRKPVHTGAIGAWQRYAQQLQPLRQRLGDFYT